MRKAHFLAIAALIAACTYLEPRPQNDGRSAVVNSRARYFEAIAALAQCARDYARPRVKSKLSATELATTAVDSCHEERAETITSGEIIARLGFPGGVDYRSCDNTLQCEAAATEVYRVVLATVRSEVMKLIAEETTPQE